MQESVHDISTTDRRLLMNTLRLESLIGGYEDEKDGPVSASLTGEQKDKFLEMFIHIMDDDLNTAGAVGLIFEKVKEMNRLMDSHGSRPDERITGLLKNDRHHLFKAARVLGLLDEHPEIFFRKLSHSAEGIDADEIERMIEERTKARAEKDWAKADVIRERLQVMGVVLEDGPQGTRWRFDV